MDKIEFPVATCPKCGVRGPVFIHKEEVTFVTVEIVICPECDTIINSNGDLEIEWFDIEDAKYFGYKVVTDE